MSLIKNVKTKEVIFNLDGASDKDTVIAAIAEGASLADADLRGFNLSGGDYSGADFSGAQLVCANMTDANFYGCNFTMANLAAADMTGSRLCMSKIINARVSNTKMPSCSGIVIASPGRAFFACAGSVEVSGFEPETVEYWLNMTSEQALELGGAQLASDLYELKAWIRFVSQDPKYEAVTCILVPCVTRTNRI